MKEGQGGRLEFGQPPLELAAKLRRNRRREARPVDNLDVYGVYQLAPLIREAVLADAGEYREGRSETKVESQRILQKVWGETASLPRYFHPSIISRCLKWAGYEALEDELNLKPAPRTFEAEMGMKIGSAAHFSFLRILRKFGVQEQAVLQDESAISGRLDFMLKNPITEEYQILDLKFPGDWAFGRVQRDGLPDYLRKTKGIYNPRPEDKLQLLIYMWGRRQEGLNVAMGNIVYINRDSGKMKESIVPWDERAEHEMTLFLDQLAEARKSIKRGELPKPTVVSTYICAAMCPYRLHCDYGQKFAAGKIKKEKKKRPAGVYRKARREAEEKRKMMERLGIVQAELPLGESTE